MRLYNSPLGRRAVESFFSRRLTENINWEQTQAYSYYWETAAWVNLSGCQLQGIVAPGDQYEQVRVQLIELISSATDAVTDQPAASRVFRCEELYSGPHLDVIPDIGVWWNQKITLEGPLIADFEGRHLEVDPAIPVPGITGGHAPTGTVIVYGPGVRSAAKITQARMRILLRLCSGCWASRCLATWMGRLWISALPKHCRIAVTGRRRGERTTAGKVRPIRLTKRR